MKKKKKVLKTRFKIGDTVKVISGKDKGKISTIKSFVREKTLIFLEGVNFKTKHYKLDKSGNGEKIKRIEYPIHISNISEYKE